MQNISDEIFILSPGSCPSFGTLGRWGAQGVKKISNMVMWHIMGAQWLGGRVLDLRPRGPGFEPHQRHCIVVLEQDTFILA